MRAVVVLLVCVGCATPDAQAPLEIPMRIVVTDGAVSVYMEAADLGSCSCQKLVFPAPGECAFLTDANPCNDTPFCASCITDMGIEVDGARLLPAGIGGSDPWTRYYGAFPAGDLSLVIAGCGHPSTRISLDGPAFAHVAATADYVDGAAHVTWMTDAAVPSTLLTLYEGLHGDLCRVQDVSEYTFMESYARSVSVQPLGSRVDTQTEFGPATIWRAGAASAMFPRMP